MTSLMKNAVTATFLIAAFGAFAQAGEPASAPVRTLERLRHAHAVPPDFKYEDKIENGRVR